ncbi:MAG TPA: metallopeptidase TldD-related protein, partial [Candidatus Nanoarchaeia archaeon]|nr:metallopeptidase TldD-related protein [Candidatus Nanoarchaeia archaeon]
ILTPSILANNILDNNSRLVDKLGKQVISKDLTIKDVPVIKGGTMNSSIDYEGIISESKDLFSKGILNCFINDLYTANRMGVKPSGNSAGLVKRGLVSPANIVIANGDAMRDELLSDCIYVNALMGTHTANIVTGDFALNALNAFKYDSKGITPIRDVMISANIFDLLNKPVLIGKESRFDASLKTPLLHFEGVQVVG